MKPLLALSLLVPLFLAGCIPAGTVPGVGENARYDINTYREDKSLNADLTGLWIALHEGTLNETVDGIKYNMTGNIREIVEITRSAGVYYVRSCLFPESRHVVSVSGNTATAAYNDVSVEMTIASNTAMSGEAWRSASSSEYSGTVQMKKVAALGETFGLFSFVNGSHVKETATASCFQEASLHVVGSQLMFSKWADVELANVSDWTSSQLRQTGYLYSIGGTADPVRQLRFADGSEAAGLTVREYPEDGETVSATITTSTATTYVSEFSLESLTGAVQLDMDIADASAVVVAPTAGSSSSLPQETPSTVPGSYDYLSMMNWMGGFWQLSMPW